MQGLYLPFHVLQAFAQYQLHLRSSTRRTKYVVSADLTLLSLIWSVAHLSATCLYAYSSVVQADYAQRYPLYPNIQLSELNPLFHALQALIATLTARRIFWDPKRKEPLSMLCMVLISVYGFAFFSFCWLYWKGRARINLLDIAELLHLVGSISWAVRLIPQVSVNWFQECVPQLNSFVYIQVVSLFYGYVCNSVVRSKILWHDRPVDKPVDASLGLVFLCCCCLMYQARIYGPKIPQ